MREDTFTGTVEAAAGYEQARGEDYDPDPRPTRSDFGPDDQMSTQDHPVVCRAKVHNPLPDGGRAPGCYHCPVCGGDVARPLLSETFVYCTARCGWTFGTASEPPF